MTKFIKHTDGRHIEFKVVGTDSFGAYDLVGVLTIIQNSYPQIEMEAYLAAVTDLYGKVYEGYNVPYKLTNTPQKQKNHLNTDLDAFLAFVSEMNTLAKLETEFKKAIGSYKGECSENYTRSYQIIYQEGSAHVRRDGRYIKVPNQAYLQTLGPRDCHFTTPSLLYNLGLLTLEDLIDIAVKTKFSRFNKKEVYQTTDYSMSEGPGLSIVPLKVSFFAINNTNRIPSQCWGKMVGSGANTSIHFMDDMAEATPFIEGDNKNGFIATLEHYKLEFSEVQLDTTFSQALGDNNISGSITANHERDIMRSRVATTLPGKKHKL